MICTATGTKTGTGPAEGLANVANPPDSLVRQAVIETATRSLEG